MAEKTKEEELADLKRVLKAREGKYGMAGSVALIKARIEELEAENGG